MKKYALAASMLFIFILSCRKKSDMLGNFTGCRISKITQATLIGGEKNSWVCSYNNDGTVSSVKEFYGDKEIKLTTFTYRSAYELATSYSNGSSVFDYLDSMVFDAAKRVVYIGRRYNTTRPVFEYQDNFTYDADGRVVVQFGEKYGSGTPDSFLWSNGDIQSRSEHDVNTGSKSEFDYTYSDTLYNTGNVTARLIDLISYGRPIYACRHLATRVIVNLHPDPDTVYGAYQVDKDGKLTYISDPDYSMPAVYIAYECR